jgi:c-di-GMP-binding flagellar brake protein YcgR
MSSAAERRWKRVKLDVRVKLWRDPEAEDAATVVRSYELSQGGMSVYAPEQMEIGTPMEVSFTLPPGDKVLRFHAVVRNVRGFRCGLEFVKVSDAERAGLARYLGSKAGVAKA